MKIILFIDSLANGGSQRQLVNLAIGLHEREHSVTVISYAPLNYYLPRLTEAGVAFECIHKKWRFDLGPVWRLARVARRQKADVMLAFLRTPSIYAEFAGFLCPGTGIVVSERDGITTSGLKMTHYIAGLCHGLATQVTANSHQYISLLAAKLPWLKNKSSVIYNGVQESFFANGRRRVASAASGGQQDGDSVSTGVKICVVATRVTEQKGLLPMVRAIALLSQRSVKGFCISWIGTAEPGNPLVAEAKRLIEQHKLNDCWHWEGQVEDIAASYEKFDVLVLPSLHEGVPNAMCEAMASGLPVVATEIADNAKIVEPGINGFLCQPDNPESLADAIEAMLALPDNNRKKMGEAAYQSAKSLFSMDQFITNWEHTLRKAMR